MKKNIILAFRLIFGLFIYAYGISLSIAANIGLAPWDAFHKGISMHTGFSIGTVNIAFSVLIVILNAFWLKEKIGIGTLVNMVAIGSFINIIMYLRIVPYLSGVLGYISFFTGMVLISFGMILYIGSGLGAGPRDGFFIGVAKKYKTSPKLAKTITEASVFAIGAFLGAPIGIGSLLFAALFGPIMQKIFTILHFDIKAVEHEYISDYVKKFKTKQHMIPLINEEE